MRYGIWLGLFLLVVMLAGMGGCNFNVGTRSDFMSGLSVQNNGLSLEDAYLVVGGAKLQKRTLSRGEDLVLSLEGVQGFTEIEGRVFPGASLQVKDTTGSIILDEPNLFAQYETTGVTPEAGRTLTISCTVGEPMRSGGEYRFSFRVWDLRGGGQIHASATLSVQ
ncbi:MAG: hypothetical protein JXQ27_13290 [Acidobacteria bacterium]|nr:hypothetical protein [Acidobacteriota bacterium]